MKNFITKLFVFVAVFIFLSGVFLTGKSSAAVNYNNIASDSVFSNSGSMSAAQIDAFLNTFPSSCISTHNSFSSPNVVGYNPTQGYLYGSNVSAGTVIHNAAAAYDLNPQVILTTLQKEQSLVSGSAGCHYNTPSTLNPCPDPPYGTYTTCVTACQFSGGCVYIAMGYDCPHYCVPNSTGFSKQVIKAAWKLKFVQQRSLGIYNWNVQKPGWDNSDDPLTPYNGYMTQGTLKRNSSSTPTYFDGFRPVNSNSLTVHLDNGATASLYSYTPFTSGNTSFYNTYTGWFGPPNVSSKNDISFVGDWDGDGKDTIGIKRGNYYLIDVDGDGYIDQTFTYGSGTETPLIGDWDGDGKDTIALRTGDKIFINNQLDSSSDFRYFYANPSDKLLVGDWDGNGTDTVSTRISDKVFINNSFDTYNDFAYRYGNSTDIILVGDWDGNGTDTVSTRISAKFFINNGLDTYNDFAFTYGTASDAPLVGDWDGNGTDTIGLKIGPKYFFNNQLDGTSDSRIVFVG